ncbi:perlucin-like protein [Pecten maximus]|uniref:perlucin-like protein n=1 Tax=Pecten maximus TaxID=6579 RepID=UPI001458F8E2|nr:perlucin-like protein [Pecten maximus]
MCLLWSSLVWSALIVHVIRGCPNGWETFDGSCYFVSDFREDWPTASTACGLYHAHLAEVIDEAEENFLKQVISKYHAGHRSDDNYWLGGSDMFVEGDWRWMNSDQRINYTNWYPGEPNNYQNHSEDCVVVYINNHQQYRWDDRKCTEKNNFICEIGDDSGAIVIG